MEGNAGECIETGITEPSLGSHGGTALHFDDPDAQAVAHLAERLGIVARREEVEDAAEEAHLLTALRDRVWRYPLPPAADGWRPIRV